jgi:5,10-methylenetetrahydromethanopterin reductase
VTAGSDGLEFGLNLLPGRDAAATLRRVELAEEYGWDFVGLGDSQLLWDDVHTLLGAAAVRTSRLRLGPWVTNVATRHESVTVNAIRTLAGLSDGRAVLGIGYGDSAVKTIGLERVGLARFREAVDRLRHSLDGAAEICWAADGPRSLADAGAGADAVIANGLLVAEHLDFIREQVAAGAGDRPVPPLIFQTGMVISDEPAAAEVAKPYLVRTLCHDVSRWIPGWSAADTADFRARYEYAQHLSAGQTLAASVPTELVPYKAIVGPAASCAARLQELIDAGLRRFCFVALGEPEPLIRRFGAEVRPALHVPIERPVSDSRR